MMLTKYFWLLHLKTEWKHDRKKFRVLESTADTRLEIFSFLILMQVSDLSVSRYLTVSLLFEIEVSNGR